MTIIQKPNPPLIAAGVGFLIGRFTAGTLHKIGITLFTATLIIWSYQEMTSGINWLRKLLGGVILLIMLINLFKRIS